MMRLGRKNGKGEAPAASAGPAVLVDAARIVDERFRLKCAVWSDGRCLIAEGHEDDPELRAALVALRRQGLIHEPLREESVSGDVVKAAWSGRSLGNRVEGANPEVVKQLRSVFQTAADLKASDVVLQNGEGGCQAFVIANDRKLRVGAAMTESVGGKAINLSLYIQEPGSGQSGYQRGSFQGFSIRNRGLDALLPPEISGLRCQRGPNEPDEDHLYARIFRRDQVPAGMTLEKLGFSPEQAELFAEIRAAMRGAVFIGGVTGDGKSTSQAVNLMLQLEESNGELNLVTVEDPVEIPIPGAVQIAVPTGGTGEEREGHYREALRHFCRIHPSSGMVSEIRDSFAARQVLQFADSGHQVWTTIHVATANLDPLSADRSWGQPVRGSEAGQCGSADEADACVAALPALRDAGAFGGPQSSRAALEPGGGLGTGALAQSERLPGVPCEGRRTLAEGLGRLRASARGRRDDPAGRGLSGLCAQGGCGGGLEVLDRQHGREAAQRFDLGAGCGGPCRSGRRDPEGGGPRERGRVRQVAFGPRGRRSRRGGS